MMPQELRGAEQMRTPPLRQVHGRGERDGCHHRQCPLNRPADPVAIGKIIAHDYLWGDGGEVWTAIGGRLPLHNAAVRPSAHSDFPVTPWLRRNPRQRIVSVTTVVVIG